MTIQNFLIKTIKGDLTLEQQKQFLRRPLNETPVSELAEAVEYLMSVMEKPPLLPKAFDMAGTGGSGLDTINTSTIAAFVLAGAGVGVAKHGNRSASGKCGSFDLLEALGVPLELDVDELQARFNAYNIAFLYARSYHPILRHFAEVRASLGAPTFFNFLGPLLSPVAADRQVIGVYDAEIMHMVAETAQCLGKKHVVVVHGSDGLDEVTVTGATHVVELKDGHITEYEISTKDFGLYKTYNPSEIKGGSIEENVLIAEALLNNNASDAHTDLVLVNAAVGLYVAGKAKNLKQAYTNAKRALQSGQALEVMRSYKTPRILRTIVSQRESDTDFCAKSVPHRLDMRRYTGGLIAEIKKMSPSQGLIAHDVDVVAQTEMYQEFGASALSVVTEPRHFGGSLADIHTIRNKTNLPILCKDFITNKKQINAVYSAGADIVLLIAAILPRSLYVELFEHAKSLGMQVLTEVHTESELRMVGQHVDIVGINARDLNTFSIDRELFQKIRPLVPKGTLCVAESGIESFAGIPEGADGWLVGTSILKHPIPKLKVKELSGKPLLKLCGIRDVESAKLCEKLGVDMIGLNFVPRSRRRITIKKAQAIRKVCRRAVLVGVLENMQPDDVQKIVQTVGLDAVQLSGSENVADYSGIAPIIQSHVVGASKNAQAFMDIIDNKLGGSGVQFDHSKLVVHEPSLIAGGIDLATAKKLLATVQPLGIDTASGIETSGDVSGLKIKQFAALVSETTYSHSAMKPDAHVA